MHDITITGNRVSGGVIVAPNNPAGGLRSNIGKVGRYQWFTFTNNTTTQAGAGPLLNVSNVDGVTIAGNVQPLTSGSLASIRNSTGVDYEP